MTERKNQDFNRDQTTHPLESSTEDTGKVFKGSQKVMKKEMSCCLTSGTQKRRGLDVYR